MAVRRTTSGQPQPPDAGAKTPVPGQRVEPGIIRPPVRPAAPGSPVGPGTQVPETVSVPTLLQGKQIQNLVDLNDQQLQDAARWNLHRDSTGADYTMDYVIMQAFTVLTVIQESVNYFIDSDYQKQSLQDITYVNNLLGCIKYLNRVISNTGQFLSVLENVVANRLNYLRQQAAKQRRQTGGPPSAQG
jgi:hypothetical protein